jgi:hypothetical protein
MSRTASSIINETAERIIKAVEAAGTSACIDAAKRNDNFGAEAWNEMEAPFKFLAQALREEFGL